MCVAEVHLRHTSDWKTDEANFTTNSFRSGDLSEDQLCLRAKLMWVLLASQSTPLS